MGVSGSDVKKQKREGWAGKSRGNAYPNASQEVEGWERRAVWVTLAESVSSGWANALRVFGFSILMFLYCKVISHLKSRSSLSPSIIYSFIYFLWNPQLSFITTPHMTPPSIPSPFLPILPIYPPFPSYSRNHPKKPCDKILVIQMEMEGLHSR